MLIAQGPGSFSVSEQHSMSESHRDRAVTKAIHGGFRPDLATGAVFLVIYLIIMVAGGMGR
ncbi:hypothetical protein MINS_38740 [Mycolicibacterium insubricum]|nr:hypothetical protein MINS_38740 [Mycolicibacterium insubricum]